jgi:NAD(P)-dependent dehydrogenase (short-subunit alcohol dehydrogenase family)
MTGERASTDGVTDKALDRVAVVTGASGNLGGAVVARLAAAGARVIAVERSRIRYRDEIICEVELGDSESTQNAFSALTDRFGRIDSVVHTVGTYRGGSGLIDTSDDDFTSLFATNVLTTANLLRAALRVMLAQGSGQIAVVASADALHAVAGNSAYGASKAAQLRMIESAAEELHGRAITLNAVLPTTMDTPQNRAAMPNADRSSWVGLQAVAEVLAFLVSPAASAIHGQAIRVGW